MLGENGTISGYADCYDLINYAFELIEEPEKIEELENEVMKDDWRYYIPMFFNKINELVQAVNRIERNKEE